MVHPLQFPRKKDAIFVHIAHKGRTRPQNNVDKKEGQQEGQHSTLDCLLFQSLYVHEGPPGQVRQHIFITITMFLLISQSL